MDSRGRVFVSTPRWKPGVPATLSLVQSNGILQPFPSWEMNQVGNASTLQSVLGFEIDPYDRLWVLDQGRVSGQPLQSGPHPLFLHRLHSPLTSH
jgi:hypothetical protein